MSSYFQTRRTSPVSDDETKLSIGMRPCSFACSCAVSAVARFIIFAAHCADSEKAYWLTRTHHSSSSVLSDSTFVSLKSPVPAGIHVSFDRAAAEPEK